MSQGRGTEHYAAHVAPSRGWCGGRCVNLLLRHVLAAEAAVVLRSLGCPLLGRGGTRRARARPDRYIYACGRSARYCSLAANGKTGKGSHPIGDIHAGPEPPVTRLAVSRKRSEARTRARSRQRPEQPILAPEITHLPVPGDSEEANEVVTVTAYQPHQELRRAVLVRLPNG